MKRTLFVNLYGGPGAGKSTGASWVFSKLKMDRINTELINEFAKQLVWEERAKTFTDQLYIFAKQNHRLHIVNGIVDVAIVDSPLLLNIIYGENNGCPSSFFHLVNAIDWGYDSIDFFIDRKQPYDTIGRMQTEPEADKVAGRVNRMLDFYRAGSVEHVPGTPEGYRRIYERVLDKLAERD